MWGEQRKGETRTICPERSSTISKLCDKRGRSEWRQRLVNGLLQMRLQALLRVCNIIEPSLAPDCQPDSNSDANSLSKSPPSNDFQTKLDLLVSTLRGPFEGTTDETGVVGATRKLGDARLSAEGGLLSFVVVSSSVNWAQCVSLRVLNAERGLTQGRKQYEPSLCESLLPKEKRDVLRFFFFVSDSADSWLCRPGSFGSMKPVFKFGREGNDDLDSSDTASPSGSQRPKCRRASPALC